MSAALKPAWTPAVRQIDAIVPGCRFHVASGVENFRIAAFGGEEVFTRQIISALRPGDVLFDIGACVGFVAVHAGKLGAQVVAFEPEPSIRRRLRENLELNGLNNVQVVGWAVSDKSGTARLHTDGQHGGSPSLSGDGSRNWITIDTGRIDDAIEARTLPTPNVIKLDVEGAEVRAVRGMTELLSGPKKPHTLFVEVHPPMISQMGDDLDEYTNTLKECGYVLTSQQGRFEQLHQIWEAR